MVIDYTPNALGQATKAGSYATNASYFPNGAFGGDGWYRYTYDALDNLKSWKLGGVKDYAEYVYNAQHQLTNIRNTAGATVVGMSYDPQGNLNNKNGQGYEFDYGNRLRGITGKEYYRYDAPGRRVLNWRYPTASTPNGTVLLSQYSQSGQLMYQEESAKPASTHIYLAGSLIATSEHTWGVGIAVKYQHTDALGSPVAVTNEAGSVIERNDYEPYGAIIGKPGYSGIGYTGHVMDGATGLTYMQQRYYDQSVGRFLGVDPVTANSGTGANFNRYWYANNNPYTFVDPDGRQSRGRGEIGESAAGTFGQIFADWIFNSQADKDIVRARTSSEKAAAYHRKAFAMARMGLNEDHAKYQAISDGWAQVGDRQILLRNPNSIRFLQAHHGSTFKAGAGSLDDLVQRLKVNPAAAADIPPIRIFLLDGQYYTLDHLRLDVHRAAGIPIKTVLATPTEVMRDWGKSTGYNQGLDTNVPRRRGTNNTSGRRR